MLATEKVVCRYIPIRNLQEKWIPNFNECSIAGDGSQDFCNPNVYKLIVHDTNYMIYRVTLDLEKRETKFEPGDQSDGFELAYPNKWVFSFNSQHWKLCVKEYHPLTHKLVETRWIDIPKEIFPQNMNIRKMKDQQDLLILTMANVVNDDDDDDENINVEYTELWTLDLNSFILQKIPNSKIFEVEYGSLVCDALDMYISFPDVLSTGAFKTNYLLLGKPSWHVLIQAQDISSLSSVSFLSTKNPIGRIFQKECSLILTDDNNLQDIIEFNLLTRTWKKWDICCLDKYEIDHFTPKLMLMMENENKLVVIGSNENNEIAYLEFVIYSLRAKERFLLPLKKKSFSDVR